MAGYEFEVKVSNADENVQADSITEMSLMISKRKCDAVFNDNKDCIIISADTIVVIDNKVFTARFMGCGQYSHVYKIQDEFGNQICYKAFRTNRVKG